MANLLDWFKKKVNDVARVFEPRPQSQAPRRNVPQPPNVGAQVVQKLRENALNLRPNPMIELAGRIGINNANIAQDFLNKIPQTQVGRKIDSNPVTKAVGGVVGEAAKGAITGVRNASTLATGQNPYKGMTPVQGAGQAGQDLLNTAGLFYAPGKIAAVKGAGLLPKLASGLSSGVKVGGAFGGAYGLTESMKTPDSTPLDYAINTVGGAAAGALTGGGLGVAIPLTGAAAKAGAKGVRQAANKAVTIYKNDPFLSSEAGKIAVPNVTGGKPAEPTNVNDSLNKAVEQQKTKYPKPSVVDKAMQFQDKNAPLVKLDAAEAKRRGIPLRDLPAEERLEYRAGINPRVQAEQLMEDYGIIGKNGLIARYGEGTPQGKELNNYFNAKFAIEVAENRNRLVLADDSGKPISVDELKAFAADYEKRNPNATKELETNKKYLDAVLDVAAEGGLITKEDAAFVKTYYKNPIPLERVLPDETVRASIDMAPVGSIGRQTILQNLEGSALPASNSFGRLSTRANAVFSQVKKARTAQEFGRRVESGSAPGKIEQSIEQAKLRKELKAELDNLLATEKGLMAGIRRKTAKSRVSNYKESAAKDRAAGKVRSILLKSVTDPDARAAIYKLSRDDLLDIFTNLVDEGAKGTGWPRRLLAARGKEAKALRNELNSMRTDLMAVRAEKASTTQDYRATASPTTPGNQIVSGIDDGVQFKIETTPWNAKALQGIGETEISGVSKFMRSLQRPFRITWTGFLNPLFQLVSFGVYDVAPSIVNSRAGFRTVFSPRAIGEMFKSMSKNSEFQKELRRAGANYTTASQTPVDPIRTAEFYAAQKNLFTKLKFYANPKNFGQLLDTLDLLGGKLAGATRTRVAAARKQQTGSTAEAVYEYNNVLPNYSRASRLLREIDAWLPLTAASVAGTRAVLTAIKRNPIPTLTKLATTVVAPITLATMYNMSTEEGQKFFDDMAKTGKQRQLDNNVFIVLPGAYKDDKTGKWEGVLKLPTPPEYRSLNSIIWKQGLANAKKEGVDPKVYATAAFDFMTGALRNQESPAYNTATSFLTNVNPSTGKEIVPRDLKDAPLSEQVNAGTSPAAKKIGELTKTSPLQVQNTLSQLALPGQVISGIGTDKGVSGTLADAAIGKFYGAYGQSSGARYYENRDKIASEIKDIDDRRAFEKRHAKNPNPGILDSAEDAIEYLNRPAVFEADRKLDAFQRAEGKLGNPLFDLSPERAKKVLTYRSAKLLNAGKQTYDKNGQPLFTALGLDEPWYDELRTKETAFYDSFKKTSGDSDPKTFSGLPKVQASPELKAKLDQYYGLPKGTGARKAFLASNPDIVAYWEASDGFTNQERAAIGLKPLSEDSGFGSSGSRRYARGGSSKTKFNKVGLKTATSSKITQPKGVKVKKLTPGKAKLTKQKVPKMTRVA